MKLVPAYQCQLNLVLDFRVALEAVLIQRLGQQPKKSQQEWLRRLLVLGFREECQCLRHTAEQATRPTSGAGFADWLTQETRVNEVVALSPVQKVETLGCSHQKPLAALQKVLGEKVA